MDDIAIFQDSLKGIEVIKKIGFSTDGIIAVNKAFSSDSNEQPSMPGHLRNAYYNDDDRIAITIDEHSHESYFPPEVITRSNLDEIVDRYNDSEKSEKDAWRVFAHLSKLQPFQDGNKRTALIAANAAYGALDNGSYLTLPFNDLDRVDFVVGLMRFYNAKDQQAEERALDRMISVLPSNYERKIELSKPIDQDNQDEIKTVRYKRELNKTNDMEPKQKTNRP
ncbi:Fic family protein (plasmid) [Latilactobacillus sakei]